METMTENIAIAKYPAYKHSGVAWLGEIPEHWEIFRANYVFTPIDLRSENGEEELLSVSEHHGVKLRSESNVNMFMAESYKGYKLCEPGDLVINSLWAWSRGLAISKYSGIVSTAYSVFRANVEKYDVNYLNYLLRTDKYVAQYLIASKGVWISRLQLSDWAFLRIPILSPSKKEQTAIANFLDAKTAQIDNVIAQKEKQIELLKERRQILIHRAVTRGLNPDVKLKDSGVEWIGQIPEHWEVKRLKYFIRDLESGVSVNASESESAENEEKGILKTSCVYNYKFEPRENKKIFKEEIRRAACPVRAHSIIISRMNAPELVGASGYVDANYPNLFLPDRLWQTIFNGVDFNAVWLSMVLTVKAFRNCVTSIATGSSPSMKNISKGDFLNLKVPTPPTLECNKIVLLINDIELKINKGIEIKHQEIEKLKEYKNVLINEAVTGKIKVTAL